MKYSDLFRRFLRTGTKPTLPREVSALLDESRSAFLETIPAEEFTPIMPAAQFIAKAEAALAKRPSTIHSATDEYRRQQGRPPLKSGMQTAARPNQIFNPPPKPTAAAPKPAASKPRATAATATPPPTASKTPLNDAFAKLGPCARTNYFKDPANRRALNIERADAALAETKAKAAAIAAKVNPNDAKKIAARKALNS